MTKQNRQARARLVLKRRVHPRIAAAPRNSARRANKSRQTMVSRRTPFANAGAPAVLRAMAQSIPAALAARRARVHIWLRSLATRSSQHSLRHTGRCRQTQQSTRWLWSRRTLKRETMTPTLSAQRAIFMPRIPSYETLNLHSLRKGYLSETRTTRGHHTKTWWSPVCRRLEITRLPNTPAW